jgi:hypothetical protein
LEKCIETVKICIETVENFGKFWKIFYPPAHLIEISMSHKKAQKTQRKINHEFTRRDTDFLDADFAGYAEEL